MNRKRKNPNYLVFSCGCVQNKFRSPAAALRNAQAISKNWPEDTVAVYELVREVRGGKA